MITLTPYLGLKKLEHRDTDYPDWGTIENENMDILDLAFGNRFDTGLIAIDVVAATGKFIRATGSYVTDRFAVGDTIQTSGFTNPGNNTTKTILTIVDATILTINGASIAGGTGYAVGEVLTLVGGIGGTVTVDTITGGGATGPVNGVIFTSGGRDYTTGIKATTSTGAGINCTIQILSVADRLITVDNTGLVNETGGGPPYHERIMSIYPTHSISHYTQENYVTNEESHSLSLDKLDIELEKDALLMPTQDQKNALIGENAPTINNNYVTKDYVRKARKKVFFPEEADSVLTPSPGGANSGNMTTASEVHGNYTYNNYKWLSSEVTLQNYDISIQWKVPETFLGFRTVANKALIVDICTQENTNTNNYAEVIIKKDGVATTSSILDKYSAVATNWYSEREVNELIGFTYTDSVLSSLVPGNILDITIRVYSKSNKYAKVGAVTIQGVW